MSEEQFSQEARKRYEASRDVNLASLNNSETEAVKQLMTIATVFLTASLFLIESFRFTDGISSLEVCTILAWLLLIISIGLGAWIFVSDIAFFHSWADRQQKMIDAIDNDLIKDKKEEDNLWKILITGLSDETSNVRLRWEIGTLIAGIVVLLIALFLR